MLEIVEEGRNNKTRHKFRQLAREASGEIFDIPEENCVIMAYDFVKGKMEPVGGVSFKLADIQAPKDDPQFVSEYHHQITFLFVRPDFQDKGVGTKLVEAAAQKMATNLPARSIRVQSAKKAEHFFAKLGFITQGDPIEIVYSGSHLFRTLLNMELKGGCKLQTRARVAMDMSPSATKTNTSQSNKEEVW